MKIAMFGTTLYAGVISSLLAESGHQVFICNDLQDHTALFNLRDQDVVRSLEKQHKSGFLSYCDFAALTFRHRCLFLVLIQLKRGGTWCC
jgi:UDPglucose 6-dehydrogenase